MHEEIRQITDSEGLLPQIEDTERLPYIEAMAQETMRLKPVAPLLFLETLEDVELGGVTIPKAAAVFLVLSHACLQETHFGLPGKFRPERWLESLPSPGCPHDVKAFVPFGAGPRFCPGRQLALTEIKVVMAMLSALFQVSKVPNSRPVTELFSFTMTPQNLLLRFQRRALA